MASTVCFLVFLGFTSVFLQSVTSDNSNEWDVERSSLNPLSYTDEGHYSNDRTTENPLLRSQSRTKCPANEHFTRCDANCQKTCANYNKPIPCPRLCIWGCVCNLGLVRGPDKKCIKATECPPPPKQQAEAQQNSLTDLKDTQTEEAEHSPNSEKNPPASKPNNWPFPLICGKNEVLVPIPTSCPDDCSNFKKKDRKCVIIPLPSCFCKEGFVRNHEGKCIKPYECPQEKNFCPTGEEFSACESHCEENCHEKKTCEDSMLCVPGCACKQGLVRGPEGTCIYSADCPTDPPTEPPKKVCPENELYEDCKAACQRNCSNFDIGIPCPRICVPGCVCKEPLIRGKYGKCVEPEECPKDDFPHDDDYPKSVTEIPSISETEKNFCPRGEEFSPCESHCEGNCFTKNPCRRSMLCVPGCACKQGLVRGPKGTCIYSAKCPADPPTELPKKVCPENELFDHCKAVCQKNCSNFHKQIPCPRICVPGCVCKEPLTRGKYGKCVEPEECPKDDFPHDDDYPKSVTEIPSISETEKPPPNCPPHHRFLPCGGHCQRDCTTKDDKDFICRPVCIPGCVCEEGLVKGPKGECIEKEKCPKSDSEGDSYVTLNPPPYTDDDYIIPESKTKIPPISETENSQFEEILPRQHSNQFPLFCGNNEIRELNPSTCPDDCNNYQDTSRKCVKSIIPACVCKKGFVRGPKKDCINPTECPQDKKDCGKGEIWTKCHGNCEKNCSNWAQDIICPKACVSGCVCRPGLIRRKDKKCVYWFKCPKKSSSYPGSASTETSPPIISAVSENSRLKVSENAGCPNDYECTISCREYGQRYGHCTGQKNLVCSCYIEKDENAEHME